MAKAIDLGKAISRLVADVATAGERRALRQALTSGRLAVATGDRAVAIGGDAADAIIVTGDGNVVTVFKGWESTALNLALNRLYPPRQYQLPADLGDFTGREEEVEKLLAVFRGGDGKAAISALGGMGGVGKTALAVHVAHKLAPEYPEAQIVMDLMGTEDTPLSPAKAMENVVRAFHSEACLPASFDEMVVLYRSVLAKKRVLLLLDNARDGAQVRPLLPPAPGGVLITSRCTLVLPGVSSINLDVLTEPAAVELLISILGPERAGPGELADLAGKCGRLPLALRVAGSFLAGHQDWTVAEYIKALNDEEERLRRLKDEVDDVEGALKLSAVQLVREKPNLAVGWQMLSVFPASFDRQAAAAVWDLPLTEARDNLSDLLVWSLVLFDPDQQRYRLHDLMRLIARKVFSYRHTKKIDGLSNKERLYQAASRHATHYFELLGTPDNLQSLDKDFQDRFLNLLYNETDNLSTAHIWALDNMPDYKTVKFNNLKKSLGSFILNNNYKELFANYPELHREVLHTMAWMTQLYELDDLKKLLENQKKCLKNPHKTMSHLVSFLEEKINILPYFYPKLFERLVVFWEQLISLPYFHHLLTLPSPPEEDSVRTVWQLTRRGQLHIKDLVQQHSWINDLDLEEKEKYKHAILKDFIS